MKRMKKFASSGSILVLIIIFTMFFVLIFSACTQNGSEMDLTEKTTNILEKSIDTSIESTVNQGGISDKNITEKDVEDALDLPQEYKSETAVSNGDVVDIHGKVSNVDRFYAFLNNVEALKPDLIRITSYTIEGDPIIAVAYYDGKKIKYYSDNTRDAFGGGKGIHTLEADEITVEEDEVKYDENETQIYKRYKLIGENSQLTILSLRDTEDSTPVSESAIKPYMHIISEESLKLQALEKTFMDSKYYREERMIPLTVTKDLKYFIAYKIRAVSMEEENELILIGMPRQMIDIYKIDLTEKKAVNMGKTEFVISHAWSENGKLLSLVSHQSVKILDIGAGSLTEVPMKYETSKIYNTNWGSDNRTLYVHLDTIANYYAYDSLSKKMVKTRGGFTEGDVVYRGNIDGKILTSKGERVGVAKGLYFGEEPLNLIYDGDVIIHDIVDNRALVSYESLNPRSGTSHTLEDYDANTGERRVLYDKGDIQNAWKIFKASFIKTTGDIIYTTFETDENGVQYLLVRIEPNGEKSVIQVPSPLFTVTPGESILHFAAFKDGDSCFMDVKSFKFTDNAQGKEFGNSDIRTLMFRALDIYSSETVDIEKIKQVFINTYDNIPQEALENILLEAEKAQYWKYSKLDIGKEITMDLKLKDKGNRASVVLNKLYFRGPHELVKKEGKWYITGLSTWPESKVRNDVYKACTKYIENEIKTGKVKDNVITSFSIIEVGEIEIWAMSDPHRAAVYPDAYAKEARVKIIVTLKDGSTEKYMAYFSKRDSGSTWVCNDMGKLSPGLFPEQ